jgi:hypothetical protein
MGRVHGQSCWRGAAFAQASRDSKAVSPISRSTECPARPLAKEGRSTVCQTLTQVRESLANSGSRRIPGSRRSSCGGVGEASGGAWTAMKDSGACVALINWFAAPRHGRRQAVCRRQVVKPPGPASATLPMNLPSLRETNLHEDIECWRTTTCSCFWSNLRGSREQCARSSSGKSLLGGWRTVVGALVVPASAGFLRAHQLMPARRTGKGTALHGGISTPDSSLDAPAPVGHFPRREQLKPGGRRPWPPATPLQRLAEERDKRSPTPGLAGRFRREPGGRGRALVLCP